MVNGQSVTHPLCPYPDRDAIYTGAHWRMAAQNSVSATGRLVRRWHDAPLLPDGAPGSLTDPVCTVSAHQFESS